MHKAVFVFGTLAIAGAGLVALSVPAAAQQDQFGDFLRCEKFGDPAERVACFDGALEKLKARRAPAPERASNPQEAEILADETGLDAGRAEREAERADREARRADREAERADREAERADRETERANREAERAALATERGDHAAAAPSGEDIDVSKAPGRGDDSFASAGTLLFASGKIVSRVARHWQDEHGFFRVELDNGQIWREAPNSRQDKYRLPGGDMVAEISRTMLGGFRLRIQGQRRQNYARVRPVK